MLYQVSKRKGEVELNLYHLMTGCSLAEISAIARMSQIGDIITNV